ncbi:efflux RND transporter periplasmic adaptor subunit [Thalassotalea atypica]|uniref:efflux RND transporter periplasmic adaptor subunit n=1 Tax=Thalassotalea atypica TaxID=2054316 RepID=UPI0025722A12|nr:HlyD family efflux transporter periplasmic adaptor subunit [Thalassotalea atypica]
MTTILNRTDNKRYRALRLIVLTVSLLSVSLWAISSVNIDATPSAADIRIAAVLQGDFDVKVSGYGRLKAKNQRMLTSQSQATVESISLYPGARVTKDTVILTLSDPQLEQELVNARLELGRQQAQAKEQIISHKSQLLEREAQIALLNSDLEIAQLRAEAERKLIDKGIVSILDYKRTQLDVRQLSQRVDIEQKRRTQLKAMQKERTNILQDLVIQYQANFQTIKKRHDRLTVRAGLDGVLQTLPVEIGQSVIAGSQLALVGSDQKLVAQLKVQHSQADQIAIGMLATVNTFGETVDAKVIRIESIVTDGRVMIELDLLGKLPANARPDLTVEGQILVKQIADTLYVEQPSNTQPYTTKNIFVAANNQKTAQLTSLEFGTVSGSQIQVVKGVQRGDKVIVSDMTQWRQQSTIELID